jgi:5'-nucleotidase
VFDRTELAGVPAYGVAASPGYIVVLAGLGAFGPPPDLVLSGVNRGANAGNAILHSGTVGAALTAAANGIRAMAVSLDVVSPAAVNPAAGVITPVEPVDDESHHWATAADVACHLLPWLADAPARTVLNLNVPDVARAAVAGLRQASLAPFGHVQMAITETGRDYVRVALEETGAREIPGSDLAWLAAGYAAVSVVRPAGVVADVALPTDLD